MKRIIVFILLLVCSKGTFCQAAAFGTARYATPVLNSPDFGSVFGGRDGSSLKTDRCGQVRELEYIALPGTVFKILSEIKRDSTAIFRVETDEYFAPAGIQLFVDSRFLEVKHNAPQPRKRYLPTRRQISEALTNSVGNPYVWGGNIPDGIPELAELFFNGKPEKDNILPQLAGLDCSGLLYHATGGWTPRNTSQLLSYGQAVPVKGKNTGEISELLKPLDLIVWDGHVIIVLDRETTIESRLECGRQGNGGVRTSPLRQRLADIMRTRRPVNSWPAAGKQRDVFVVRRWYGL